MGLVQILGERLTGLDKNLIFHHPEQHTEFCDHPTVNTQPVESQQEPLMVYLVKYESH